MKNNLLKNTYLMLCILNTIIAIFFLLGFNIIELEKISLLPDIEVLLLFLFFVIFSIYCNLKSYKSLRINDNKGALKYSLYFMLLLYFLGILVYDFIDTFKYYKDILSQKEIFEKLFNHFIYRWKYNILFFLNYYIPIRYFYLLKKNKNK